MLETSIKQIDFDSDNFIKCQHITLENDIEAVILFSLKDKKLEELLYNKIIDVLIDRIHPKNVYKDFSHALENINGFLMSWKHDDNSWENLSAIIGIYAKKTFFFSTVGRASCYLYNSHGDVIEITDKSDISKDFSFISSGEVADGESLIMSNTRLYDVLSSDDIKDALKYWLIPQAGDTIESILLREHTWKNVVTCILQKKWIVEETKLWKYLEKAKYIIFSCLDNNYAKTGISRIYQLRDKILGQWKRTQQVVLWIWVILATYLLFTVVSWFFQITSQTWWVGQAREQLLQAQEYIVTASENMNDEDVFSYNIEAAEDIIAQINDQELFLGDITKLQTNISSLQKKINGIEVFSIWDDDILTSFDATKTPIGLVDVAGKKYFIGANSVIGPLANSAEPTEYIFSELSSGDTFVSATSQDNDIVIITQSGKLVRFSGNNFSYVDVANQDTWSNSPIIENYARNIYLLSDEQNQILMHRKAGENYEAAVPYLNDEDAISTWRILDIAIDGGIYILKLDGTMLKLFRSPAYRLESLSLNNLPKNYNFSNLTTGNLPSIQTQANLTNVYMLLDNRILIFKPNTLRFQDVKSLKYVGQIEWQNRAIKKFYVENDGEIYFTDSQWVYKIEFEILEDRIIMK